MEIIDSRQKKLEGPEILVMAAYSNNGAAAAVGEVYPPGIALAAITKELSMPRADIVQFGNTIYLSHRGKGKNNKKMVGRAFNVDTGKNFVNNSLKYINYLQKKGITHYTTWFNGQDFLNGFRVFQRFTKGSDTEIGIAERENDGYIVYIKIGKKPIAIRNV
jgi:hypothetical protein|tara:strand:- start:1800 stop:2285 length:486 start_codon:yes stop_codon:yes gene_type:complete